MRTILSVLRVVRRRRSLNRTDRDREERWSGWLVLELTPLTLPLFPSLRRHPRTGFSRRLKTLDPALRRSLQTCRTRDQVWRRTVPRRCWRRWRRSRRSTTIVPILTVRMRIVKIWLIKSRKSRIKNTNDNLHLCQENKPYYPILNPFLMHAHPWFFFGKFTDFIPRLFYLFFCSSMQYDNIYT